ncbi:hypothetical protein J3R30DRAFT_636831 [Lentinula aciculospora]|uniref:Uncharacterized protein n=1 Tax=Lentinula aciculospora TaxID=153920 RepID=A0A9W9A5N0_9AGAR|nr:hypothetical protein J3R30DRAFT_636831 [Lentinula aciculospora]
MGRVLYSQSYTPLIREPSSAQYEKWSISNPFDPDSEEFFEGAQYEAFLPTPASSSTSSDNSNTPSRVPISATRSTMSRDVDQPPRTSRVRISSESPTVASGSNPMIFDSVPRDLPDMDAPTLPTSPPPVTISDYMDADVDSARPTPSPMAADSDPEDPIRILARFANDYRISRSRGETGSNISVYEILRQLDERWRREGEDPQISSQDDNGSRPQRYLPPLSYPSSNTSSSSSRADSPSSPIFFPSPPSEPLPTPSPMTRELAAFHSSEPSGNFAFDEDLEQVEREFLDFESQSLLDATDPLPVPLSESYSVPETAVASIPISQSQTPPRPVRIHHRAPSTFGNEVGLDMSPPPSVSPRLYNWARTRPASHSRYDSISSSPVDLGRRDELHTMRSIAISEANQQAPKILTVYCSRPKRPEGLV